MKIRTGFTLIEVLILLGVIGILALIGTNKFETTREEAFQNSLLSKVREINFEQHKYELEHGDGAVMPREMAEAELTEYMDIAEWQADEGALYVELKYVDREDVCRLKWQTREGTVINCNWGWEEKR